jgi:hypothetical protein
LWSFILTKSELEGSKRFEEVVLNLLIIILVRVFIRLVSSVTLPVPVIVLELDLISLVKEVRFVTDFNELLSIGKSGIIFSILLGSIKSEKVPFKIRFGYLEKISIVIELYRIP